MHRTRNNTAHHRGVILRKMAASFLHPITWARLLIATLAFGLLQAAGSRLPFIEPFFFIQPAVGLLPFAGAQWGPAGALGALLGLLGADALTGVWTAVSPWRAAGWALGALTCMLLWLSDSRKAQSGGSRSSSWGHYISAALPGVLLAAAVESMGADLSALYPMTYTFSILAIHHTGWALLFSPLVYDGWVKGSHTQHWLIRAGHTPLILPAAGRLALWVGALGTGAAGLAFSWVFLHMPPFRPYVLGVHSDWKSLAPAFLFFLLWCAGLFSVHKPR